MNTIEQQAVEYGEALNDIADALDAPTGSSPAQVVELARKAMCQRQPSTDLMGAKALLALTNEWVASASCCEDNEDFTAAETYRVCYNELRALIDKAARPAFAARAEAWITGGKGPMPTMSDIESMCGMLAEPAASAPAQSAEPITLPAEGWTGRKCQKCKGTGEIDAGVGRCGYCGGTGDEWGKLSAEPDAKRDAGDEEKEFYKWWGTPGQQISYLHAWKASTQATQRRCADVIEALEYWLPEREPLYAQHDEVSIAHRRKWHEAKSLVKQWRAESAKEQQS